MDRRQFFKVLGAGAALFVAPAALTDAIASLAPEVVADPLGAWLPLNGDLIPAAELPDLAKVMSGKWLKDGMIQIPNLEAKVQDVEHFVFPDSRTQSPQLGSRITERVLPIRYMIKARKDEDDNSFPVGCIMAFAS